jgi:MFS transporter, putative metabolite:H+ symporter
LTATLASGAARHRRLALGAHCRCRCFSFGRELVLLGPGIAALVRSAWPDSLFPTKLRATSAGWGAGRVVSALVPIVLLPLLGTQGPLAMFGLIAALLISIFLIFAAGPPGLTKKPVQ